MYAACTLIRKWGQTWGGPSCAPYRMPGLHSPASSRLERNGFLKISFPTLDDIWSTRGVTRRGTAGAQGLAHGNDGQTGSRLEAQPSNATVIVMPDIPAASEAKLKSSSMKHLQSPLHRLSLLWLRDIAARPLDILKFLIVGPDNPVDLPRLLALPFLGPVLDLPFDLDLELTPATTCWSKRGKPAMFEARSVNKMCLINVRSLDTLRNGRSVGPRQPDAQVKEGGPLMLREPNIRDADALNASHRSQRPRTNSLQSKLQRRDLPENRVIARTLFIAIALIT
ncbi:hypothetical protein H4582DRAFT_2052632 [Lactarius indigo]|nr:hypothetical protein H4582DRAFT_2052632 [Lactarius indigo]